MKAKDCLHLSIDKNFINKGKLIGKGGFGVINEMQARLAIKEIILDDVHNDPKKASDLAFEEYKLMTQNFPNVVRALGYFHDEENNRFLFSMDLYDNNLNKLISRNPDAIKPSFTHQEFYPIFCDVLNGLHSLFRKKLSHLNLKPENILLDSSRRAYISDIGTANTYKHTFYKKNLKDSFWASKNLCWMSPEMKAAIVGKADLSELDTSSSDVFSLGMIALAALDSPSFFSKLGHLNNLGDEKEMIAFLNDFENKCNNTNAEFMNILREMLRFDPNHRITIDRLRRYLIGNQIEEDLKYFFQEKPGLLKLENEYLDISLRFENILLAYGEALRFNGKHTEALDKFNLLYEITRKTEKIEENEKISRIKFDIAAELEALGRFDESLKLFQEIEASQKNIFNTELHVDVTKTMRKIATLWSTMGKKEKGLQLLNHTLELQKKVYKTEEHPEVASTMYNIARLKTETGDFLKAIEIYERVLEIQKKNFKTEEHSDVTKTMNNIASVWSSMGEYSKALDQFNRLLDIKRKIFKDDEHPEIIKTLENIALLWGEMGDNEKAITQLKKLLDIQKKIYKTDEHPDVCTSMENIALIWSELGENEKALKIMNKVLETRKIIFKTDQHPEVSRTLLNIAANLSDMGKHQLAIEQYGNVLETQKRIFKSEDHPDIALTNANLAIALKNNGKLQRAKKHYEKALEIYSKIFPDSHPEIKKLTAALADINLKNSRK